MNKYRPFITLLLILAILFLPYWLYVPGILAAAVLLPLYWEAILLGFLIDILYGAQGTFRSALSALLFVALLVPARERLRWTS